MSIAQRPVNEDHKPSDDAEKALDVIRDEKRVNPMRIREATDIRKQYVNDALNELKTAGWIRKVNRGLYEFIDDPREDDIQGEGDDVDELIKPIIDGYRRDDPEAVRAAVENLCENYGDHDE